MQEESMKPESTKCISIEKKLINTENFDNASRKLNTIENRLFMIKVSPESKKY